MSIVYVYRSHRWYFYEMLRYLSIESKLTYLYTIDGLVADQCTMRTLSSSIAQYTMKNGAFFGILARSFYKSCSLTMI